MPIAAICNTCGHTDHYNLKTSFNDFLDRLNQIERPAPEHRLVKTASFVFVLVILQQNPLGSPIEFRRAIVGI